MYRYVKKPIEITAYDLSKPEEYEIAQKYIQTADDGKKYVETLEGRIYDFNADDFLIVGINGEPYPCKRDIFFKTYTKV